MSLKSVNAVNPAHPKRVALGAGQPGSCPATTGWPVGFWWSELAHPYYEFTEVGYQVELFSPQGGPCEAEAMSDPNDAGGYSATDLISQGFIHTPALRSLIDHTRPVAELQVAELRRHPGGGRAGADVFV